MINVCLNGAAGRMGAAIIRLIKNDPELSLSGAVELSGSPLIGKDAGEAAGAGKTGIVIDHNHGKFIKNTDVIIDFSSPEAALNNLKIAVENGKALVIGTTGIKEDGIDMIKNAAEKVPVCFAPNMSIGVNLLFKLAKEAAKILKDKDYDIEITEVHHRFKKDAPSGTALKLAKVIAEEKGLDLKETMVTGREGITGERKIDTIGVMSIRSGDVIGEHTVVFGTLGERIELTHKAHNRDTFAKGALTAAKFIVNKDKGLFDMQDVLGIK
jgi:4-hydroxy-tetrahydrodipicolinate reductase